ncbi:MAG TPA: hypothetical protein VFM54_24340 [Micromonosporaceae bacterium]|nr:hypothetical protein [Micromonosporaceae bacterium]
MGLLSRDQILGADDRRYEEVECPEWGGAIRLRSLTGAERDAFEAQTVQQRGKDQRLNLLNVRSRLVVACAVDAEGQQLFSADDVRALGRKSAKALDRCFEAAQRLCGMSEEDVQELTEGFGDAQSDGPTSG